MPTTTPKNDYNLSFRFISWLFPLLVITLHLLITYEEKKPMLYILSNWGYYRALLFSTVTATAIILWVRQQFLLLDKRLPWTVHFTKRLWWQLLRGVLLPMIFIVGLATVYFAFLQINILHTVYFRRYLLLMVLLLVIVNLVGLVWYLFVKRRPYIHGSKLMHQSLLTKQSAEIDIACIFIENGQCFYCNLAGQRFFWTKTFKEACDALAGEQFFLIRRGTLVNRQAIATVMPQGSTLKLTLHFELEFSLLVSNRNIADFKHWFAQTSTTNTGLM